MEFLTVDSSKIIKIGYDRNRQEMEVHFKNGHIYLYSHVPANFYTECVLAESIGKYFYNNIKNSFPYQVLK